MRCIWIIPSVTAFSWLYLLSTFTPANLAPTSPAVFLLGFGIICGAIALRKKVRNCLPPLFFICAIPLTILTWLLPMPYCIGPVLMLGGLCLNALAITWPPARSLTASFLLTGFMLLLQSAVIPFIYVIGSRIHEIKLFNLIAYPLIRLLNLDASISEGIIYLPSFEELSAFPGTLEKFGYFELILFATGGLILLGIFQRRLKHFIRFMCLCLGYAVFRYVVMLVIFAQVIRAEIYWHPVCQIFSWIPLAIITAIWMPLGDISLPKNFAGTRHQPAMFMAILSFVTIFCTIGTWSFDDPGIRKPGRILIDEAHSDWEWSTRKFDTTWFGSQSTYNYYNLVQYLNYFYSVHQNTRGKLDKERLSHYDVLILKTPTHKYEDDEIAAITEFVRQGGGLWLIGDHTNVFGMNYYINYVAKPFGLFFHYDSTYDLDKGTLSQYTAPKLFAHPVVRHMPRFLFATSCTMDAPFLAENIIIGYGLRSRLLAYSEFGFFQQEPTQDYEFGLFIQAAGTHYGNGRVVAFTDSTCFSNFYMFIPGKPELALGSIDWLNRKNRYHHLNWILGVIALAGLIGLAWMQRKYGGLPVAICLFSGLFAAVCAIWIFSYITDKAYPVPKPHTNYPRICFEMDHSDFLLPLDKLVDKDPKSFHTFYVWTQRLGYVPEVKYRLVDALEPGGFIVMINPVKPFSQEDIRHLTKFVENGGRLLILDGPQNKNSSANSLLNSFGIQIQYNQIAPQTLYGPDQMTFGKSFRSGSVHGVTPLVTTQTNATVFGVMEKGKGKIGVMADSALFSNTHMGTTQITPDQIRQNIYQLEFFIFRAMETSPPEGRLERSHHQ